MKFTMEIQCETVAFGDKPILHLSHILAGIANTIQYIGNIDQLPKISTPVFDVNGSEVGSWNLEQD